MGKNVDPWDCKKCGAKVFVDERVHAYVCYMYKDNPDQVKSSHTFYNEWFLKNLLKRSSRKKGKEF